MHRSTTMTFLQLLLSWYVYQMSSWSVNGTMSSTETIGNISSCTTTGYPVFNFDAVKNHHCFRSWNVTLVFLTELLQVQMRKLLFRTYSLWSRLRCIPCGIRGNLPLFPSPPRSRLQMLVTIATNELRLWDVVKFCYPDAQAIICSSCRWPADELSLEKTNLNTITC